MTKENTLLVKQFMSANPVRAVVPSSRTDVLSLIQTEKYLGLPVVRKEDDTLVGIVTAEDLIRQQDETQTAMLMSRDVVTVHEDDPLEVLLEKMVKTGHRRFPVVTKDEKLVGIITVTDLRDKLLARGKYEELVENYMPSYCVVTWEDMPIPLASEQMRLGKVKMMPVLNTELKVTGILTYYDFLKVIEIVDREKTVDLQSFGEGEPGSWDSNVVLLIATKEVTLPSLPIKTVMTTNPITVYRGSTVTDAAKKMRRHDIDALPVIDSDGSLIGIIRDKDLVKALLESL